MFEKKNESAVPFRRYTKKGYFSLFWVKRRKDGTSNNNAKIFVRTIVFFYNNNLGTKNI